MILAIKAISWFIIAVTVLCILAIVGSGETMDSSTRVGLIFFLIMSVQSGMILKHLDSEQKKKD